MSELERYFEKYQKKYRRRGRNICHTLREQKIFYGDWIASGRLYRPIESKLLEKFGPYVANTHTEATTTGTLMTKAYHHSHEYIKKHVNAGPNDVILTAGFGMTAVINKLQRILSLKGCGGS